MDAGPKESNDKIHLEFTAAGPMNSAPSEQVWNGLSVYSGARLTRETQIVTEGKSELSDVLGRCACYPCAKLRRLHCPSCPEQQTLQIKRTRQRTLGTIVWKGANKRDAFLRPFIRA